MGADALLRDYLSSISIKDVVEGTKLPSIIPEFCQPNAFKREVLEEKYPKLGCHACNHAKRKNDDEAAEILKGLRPYSFHIKS